MNPFLQRGVLLFQRDRFREAAEQFRLALSQEPSDARAKAWLALSLSGMEQYAEATRMAEEAVHAAPDDELAFYALAQTFQARNKLPEALAAIQEAVRLGPWDETNFALKSQIHLDLRDWKSALAAAEQGLQIEPESIACNNLRAIALTKLGRGEDASAAMESVLARNPENVTSHATQGWNHLHGGRVEPALEHFREAMRLDPNNEWARSGIVEAMKARNPVYGILLRYFLWMGSLSGRTQGLILFGGYFGNRFLGAISSAHPVWAPWLLPLRVAYVAFALSTWLASPLFNLFLRFDKYGRHALSSDQVTASNWLGGTIFMALVGLIGCFFSDWSLFWIVVLMVFGLVAIPLSGIFNLSKGWPRFVMAGITAAIFLVGLGAILLIWSAEKEDSEKLIKSGLGLMTIFAAGVLLSSILANFLVFRRVER